MQFEIFTADYEQHYLILRGSGNGALHPELVSFWTSSVASYPEGT
jgi:hypothetical protein